MGSEGLFSIMDIGSTGLMAERVRMNTIANNIANADTTKAADGKPYRRKVVIFTSNFSDEMQKGSKGTGSLGGVKIKEIKESKEPFQRAYIPSHPEADKDGYVLSPNVNGANEMIDMMTSSRAYEANLAIMRSAQRMVNKTLQAFAK